MPKSIFFDLAGAWVDCECISCQALRAKAWLDRRSITNPDALEAPFPTDAPTYEDVMSRYCAVRMSGGENGEPRYSYMDPESKAWLPCQPPKDAFPEMVKTVREFMEGPTTEDKFRARAALQALDRIGDAAARKAAPVFSGVLRYFPDALVAVAELSRAGNEQHNPGTPLHWDRAKSGDEGDALVRHQLDAGTLDVDGQRHSAKVAWRALAQLQKEIEAERGIVRT